MKSANVSLENWDDLVFENRNQDYGAYELRRNYSLRMAEALLSALFIAALIALGYGFSGGNVTKMHEALNPGGGFVLDPPPVIDPLPKFVPKQQVHHTPNQLAPQLVTAQVDEFEVTKPAEENQEVTTGDDTGTGVSESTGEVNEGVVAVTTVEPNRIFDLVEVMPAYEGGIPAMMKFVQRKMRYPHRAQIMGTEGTVFVQFVVNLEGKVVDVSVVKGISAECDKEAARVIALMTAWKPGIQNKMPVSVRMVLPIKFRLE